MFPGCPPIADVMMSVVTHILVLGQLPALDSQGRPKEFYGRRVHDTCYRRPTTTPVCSSSPLTTRTRARAIACIRWAAAAGHLQRLLGDQSGTRAPVIPSSQATAASVAARRASGQRPVLPASGLVPRLRHREHRRYGGHGGGSGHAGRSRGPCGGDQHSQTARDRGKCTPKTRGVVRAYDTRSRRSGNSH